MSPVTAPTPDEIRAWRHGHRLSAAAAGDLVYTSGRTWLRWEAGDVPIPLACWDLAQRRIADRARAPTARNQAVNVG